MATIDTATWDDFKMAATELFGHTTNKVTAHFKFNTRSQGQTESVDEYVTELRSLMADCDFGGRESYHLAIQLVVGCTNADTQRKLLAEKDPDYPEHHEGR